MFTCRTTVVGEDGWSVQAGTSGEHRGDDLELVSVGRDLCVFQEVPEHLHGSAHGDDVELHLVVWVAFDLDVHGGPESFGEQVHAYRDAVTGSARREVVDLEGRQAHEVLGTLVARLLQMLLQVDLVCFGEHTGDVIGHERDGDVAGHLTVAGEEAELGCVDHGVTVPPAGMEPKAFVTQGEDKQHKILCG